MLLLWDKRGRYEMPDAGCQNSEISAVVPPGWEFLWGALEGLEVPLGGSRGLGVLLGGLWLQTLLSAQNRIIWSNLKNTIKYVINTIRRIIRLRRLNHPWQQR